MVVPFGFEITLFLAAVLIGLAVIALLGGANVVRALYKRGMLRQFTLRDLLLLTLVVAMGCGWWVDRAELVRGRQEVADEFQKHRDFCTTWHWQHYPPER